MTVPSESFIWEMNVVALTTPKDQVWSHKLLSRHIFRRISSLLVIRPCSHPKTRQKQYPKTSLGRSSPVPELLKQDMNDGGYIVWSNLSCFQKRAFLLVLLVLLMANELLAHYGKEERKLVGFIKHDNKPGRRKGKLFISSQRRPSAKKY